MTRPIFCRSTGKQVDLCPCIRCRPVPPQS
jgi:hypothetical protein